MGKINDKYKNEIEHSVLLNGHPIDNHEIVDGRIIIKPESYSRPKISDSEKEMILKELVDDLNHYGLKVINTDDKYIKIKAKGLESSFEIDVPKSLVIPYDDDIFGDILKQQQLYHSHNSR